MAYADTLRSKTFTGPDIANLIEGIFVAGHPAAWTTWTPSPLGATGSMTFTTTTIQFANYIQIGKLVFVSLRIDGTIGGTVNTGITVPMPVTSATTTFDQVAGARIFTNGAGEAGYVSISSASTTATFYRTNTGNYVAGSAAVSANFVYRAA